jgi:hypothetical protein
MIPGASAKPAVYLVELRATHASSLEIRGTHLAVATARQRQRPGQVAERNDHPPSGPEAGLSLPPTVSPAPSPHDETAPTRHQYLPRLSDSARASSPDCYRFAHTTNQQFPQRAIRWPAKATGRT